MTDITAEAVLLLRAVEGTRGRFGLNLPIEILRGARNAKVTKLGFDRLGCHGQGALHSAEHWKAVGRSLVKTGLVDARSAGKGKGYGKGAMAVYGVSSLGQRLLQGDGSPVHMDLAADAAAVNAKRQQRATRKSGKRSRKETSSEAASEEVSEAEPESPASVEEALFIYSWTEQLGKTLTDQLEEVRASKCLPEAEWLSRLVITNTHGTGMHPRENFDLVDDQFPMQVKLKLASGADAQRRTETTNQDVPDAQQASRKRGNNLQVNNRKFVATPHRKRLRSSASKDEAVPAAVSATACASSSAEPLAEPLSAPPDDLVQSSPKLRATVAPSTLPTGLDSALMSFQRTGVAFAMRREGRCLIGDDMGLGKTIQAIAVCCGFRADWPAVIVVPNSVRLVWADELERWIPDLGPGGVNIVQSGQDVAGLTSETASFHILTYGLLARACPVRDFLCERRFKVVVVDESHMIKNKDALRTQQVLEITKNATRVLLLSGTPALARPVELFTQVQAVEPGLFPSYHAFTKRYCAPKMTPYGLDVTGASHLKELHSHLGQIMVRRLKKDVLHDLPSKRRQRIQLEVNCSAGMTEMSNQLKANAHQDLDRDAKHKLLMQLFVESGKAKAAPVCEYVLDLLQGGCKFLVFGHHRDMLDALEEAVKSKGVKYIRIDGSVSAQSRHQQVKDFQADENVRVAVLSLMAAGVGITLTAASTVVFAELHWTPGILVQAEDRAHRIGQKNSVNIHYLVAKDTIDDIIWPSVENKVKIVSSMCDGKKNHLVAGFSSASDAVELAGKRDMDDLVSSLEATGLPVQPELESAAPDSDSKPSVAAQDSPTSALARIRQLNAVSPDQAPQVCSFHVSLVTGRVHVLDARGHPWGQGVSFKLADWQANRERALPEALLGEPEAARATEVFLGQWSFLRPIEKRELMNRVLTLPLATHLRKQQSLAAAKSGRPISRQSNGRGILKMLVAAKETSAPSMCSWCEDEQIQGGSLYCSPTCEANGAMTSHASFGKAFTSLLLAAIHEAGPYRAELDGVTLEAYECGDAGKAGSKLPARHCRWNDGWDTRTLVTLGGKGMSFRALKERLDASTYAEAESKIAELKDQIKAVAVKSVRAAKTAAVQSVSEAILAETRAGVAAKHSRDLSGEDQELVLAISEAADLEEVEDKVRHLSGEDQEPGHASRENVHRPEVQVPHISPATARTPEEDNSIGAIREDCDQKGEGFPNMDSGCGNIAEVSVWQGINVKKEQHESTKRSLVVQDGISHQVVQGKSGSEEDRPVKPAHVGDNVIDLT